MHAAALDATEKNPRNLEKDKRNENISDVKVIRNFSVFLNFSLIKFGNLNS